MNGLEKPQFIDTDAQSILDACIAEYERLTGRPLYPAQSERLLINLIAYREHLVRVGIQEAAEQNLVAFARAPMLDYLGELVGVTRIPAQPARCILRFSLDAPAVSPVFIPAGTGVYSNDGKHLFTTEADGTIESGVVAIDVSAVADEAGEDANGLKPGNVSPLAGDVTDEPLSVRNVDVTSGGSDEETDDHFRERIMLAPETFSVAGSELAYRYHVLSASASIVDVGVLSPTPGVVELYPLTKTGIPDSATLALVKAKVGSEKVRPLTDRVTVIAPEPVRYTLSVSLTLYKNADADAVKKRAQVSLAAHAEALRADLGRDVVRSQFIDAALVSGVYDVEIVSPAADVILTRKQWADCTGITVNIEGRADG
ncbi:baseplate J/gp47 family protein [uncultured Bilophila sp.]|uniref:baseplate assembly protein n=1 Tax=uncultured Bilophila sp. TaxID=529385 RepID=UPI0026DDBC61|nr:baseplate J/gp47 family protein [uncultured Bilophila sp.]